MTSFDIYLDLEESAVKSDGLGAYLSVFQHRVALKSGQRVTASAEGQSTVLRDGRQYPVPHGVSSLAHALDLAHLDRRGLFVIVDAWIPSQSAIGAIVDLAGVDPNIGIIQPRFAVGRSGDLRPLPSPVEAPIRLLPRGLAGMLPEFYVLPEFDAACAYITPQGIPACGPVRTGAGRAALRELQIGLRRRGFRNLIANRVIMDYPLPPLLAYRRHAGESIDAALAPDGRAGESWLQQAPAFELERLLSEGMTNGRKRLLLDCRGMTPAHNGTAHAILGYLLGFHRLRPTEWEVSVCVGREAAAFHGLTRRYPGFRYEYDRPQSTHLVAFHLSQPWSMDIMGELHDAAPLVAFNILDTIAWDAIYPAPDQLDLVTRFAARFADGLTYLSEHSRLRFRFRFPTHDLMREAVAYLSTSPGDYGVNRPAAAIQSIGILVIGNLLDHKDVSRTTDKLADAFPFTQIVAFGSGSGNDRPNVRTTVASGLISDASVRDLFERASVIVYPSFSEGFGLPVVQGLSLGKHVVVRDLPLWDEIERRTTPNGRLRTFRTDAELVDAVGRALEDDRPVAAPSDGAEAIGWSDCAAVLIAFADGLVESFGFGHWQSRDLALRPSFLRQ